MTFQASDAKGRQFLKLLDDDLYPIESSYSKGGLWLKFFGHSNSLYIRALRAIINHVPIREYHLKFFPLSVHINSIWLKWDDIFSINVKSSTIIGILDRIQ